METRKKVSTLEGVKLTHKRRDGNTTRIIDNAIQIIFNENICVCKDHYDHIQSHRIVFNRIINRLKNEKMIDMVLLDINEKDLEISIKPWQ